MTEFVFHYLCGSWTCGVHEKKSFVLFGVLGSPLCQSSVRMVSHSSEALTNTFLWQRHFWRSLRQNFRATSEKTPFGISALVLCTQHLSRYVTNCFDPLANRLPMFSRVSQVALQEDSFCRCKPFPPMFTKRCTLDL